MSLNLTVEIDENSGFCFGVVEAINKAEKELDNGVKLFCLGEIVHNDEEIERLTKKGIRIIDKNKFKTLTNENVLFRAHGEPPETYKIAEENKINVIDASCPIIKKLQQKIKKSYNNNETIVIYGKPNHPEVIALNGQIDNNGIIVETPGDVDLKKLPQEITFYSQTTQSLDGFYELVQLFKDGGKKVKVKDTICRRVSNRRLQLEKFCKKYNKIIFVAGKQSSNGKILYDVCKNVNTRTFFISKPGEIKNKWFKPGDTVGVTGATSTPNWLTKEIKMYLEKL